MLKAFRLSILICTILVVSCASDQEKTKDFVDKGQAAYDAGHYNEAVIQVKNAIQISPKSLAAHELLAKIYLKQGDARGAFGALQKIEQLNPDDLDNSARVASFYLLGRNVEETKKRVDRILEKQPDHIQALFLKAGLLSGEAANLPQVEEIYRHIVTIDPKQSRARLALARIFNGQKNYDAAEQQLQKARETAPDDTGIYRNLFDFYLARKAPDKALTVLKELISQKPDEAAPYVFLANFYQGEGKLDEAEASFKQAIDKNKKDVTVYMHLARLLNGRGKIREAESWIQQALALEPDDAAVKTAYAEFHFSHGQLAQARQMVDEILAKRPDFLQAKALSGKLLLRERRYGEAVTLFSQLVKDEPNDADLQFLLGSALNGKGELTQAKSALSKAIEKDPNHIQARLLMADIHMRQRDVDLAEDNVRRVLELRPDDYRANLTFGTILMVRKEDEKARQIFQRLVRQDSGNPAAYYRLGTLDRAEKKYDQAEQHLKKALDLNPSLMDVFSALVSVYALQKQYDKAITAVDAHMGKAGGNKVIAAILLNLKGNMLLAKGDTAAGEAALASAIENNPKYLTPYLTLGKLHYARKQWDKTEQIYKDLNANLPEQAMGHGLLGTLYERLGKKDLAEAQYTEALKIDPDHIPAVNNLAYLYAQEGRELNKALDLARKAKERLGRVPAIMDTLGWVYYKKELFDSAVSEFESCVEMSPRNPTFHYHLGLVYHRLGKTGQAKDELQKALDLNADFSGADDARSIIDQL